MNRLHRQLLTRVGAMPAGERLPVSRFARELLCSQSVIVDALSAMVADGLLDRVSLRAPVAVAPPQVAAPEAGAHAGQILFDRLIAEGRARGLSTERVSKAVFGGGSQIYGLRHSPRPIARTVAKVEDWISDAGGTPSGADLAIGGCPRQPFEPALVPGAADEAGARSAQIDRASAERPTGAQLFREIEDFLAATPGMTLAAVGAILGRSAAGVTNIKKALAPKPETVERVRAIIAGHREPFEPVRRISYAARCAGPAVTDDHRVACGSAHDRRLPGESLCDAVDREAREAVEQRATARSEGNASASRIDLARIIPHHPKARRFEALPPGIWSDLRALADEIGESAMDLLPRVVERGIEAMRA